LATLFRTAYGAYFHGSSWFICPFWKGSLLTGCLFGAATILLLMPSADANIRQTIGILIFSIKKFQELDWRRDKFRF
jgi:hypothetical protein